MAPLIEGISEPKLGDKEKKEQENLDYASPLNISLSDQKKTASEGLYGNFSGESDLVDSNKINEIKEINENIDLQQFKENPNFPILERFSEVPGINISEKDILTITKGLKGKDIININKKDISNLKLDDKKTENRILNYISIINKLNPKKSLDNNNEVKIPTEFKDKPILQNEKNPIVKLLAKNYTKFPSGKNGESDFDKDILTTFEITANKIIDGKQFPRNESFDRAIKDVKNGDIETRFQALTYINSLVNTGEGLKSKTSINSYKKIKGEHEKIKDDYLDFTIEKLNIELVTAEKKRDIVKIKELESEIVSLEAEKMSGDVFEAGDLDGMGNVDGNVKEQA